MSKFQNSGLNFGTSAPPHKNGGQVGGAVHFMKNKGLNQKITPKNNTNKGTRNANQNGKRNHDSQFVDDFQFIRDPDFLEKNKDSGETLMTDRMKDLKNLDGRSFSCRFLIPAGIVGEIIGKKGKNVKDMQSMSGAGISLSKKSEEFESPERILTITGTIPKVRDCTLLILDSLLHRQKQNDQAFPIIISPDQLKNRHQQNLQDPNKRADMVQVCLVLPQELCGTVIGKNSQFLRLYKPTFGGFVHGYMSFPPNGMDTLPGSSERIVSITGEPVNVANTLRACLELVFGSFNYQRIEMKETLPMYFDPNRNLSGFFDQEGHRRLSDPAFRAHLEQMSQMQQIGQNPQMGQMQQVGQMGTNQPPQNGLMQNPHMGQNQQNGLMQNPHIPQNKQIQPPSFQQQNGQTQPDWRAQIHSEQAKNQNFLQNQQNLRQNPDSDRTQIPQLVGGVLVGGPSAPKMQKITENPNQWQNLPTTPQKPQNFKLDLSELLSLELDSKVVSGKIQLTNIHASWFTADENAENKIAFIKNKLNPELVETITALVGAGNEINVEECFIRCNGAEYLEKNNSENFECLVWLMNVGLNEKIDSEEGFLGVCRSGKYGDFSRRLKFEMVSPEMKLARQEGRIRKQKEEMAKMKEEMARMQKLIGN